SMRPDFGQIEWIKRAVFSLLFCHHLDLHFPYWIVFIFNGFVQIPLMAFSVSSNQGYCFLIGKIFNALLSFKMKFYPTPLIIFVDHTIGMTSITIHVAIGSRDSPVAHRNGHLV